MKDFLGNTIKVGSYVAYPGRRGSSLWMNVGRVAEMNTVDGSLTVDRIRESGAGHYGDTTDTIDVIPRRVRVYLDRVVVVDIQ